MQGLWWLEAAAWNTKEGREAAFVKERDLSRSDRDRILN